MERERETFDKGKVSALFLRALLVSRNVSLLLSFDSSALAAVNQWFVSNAFVFIRSSLRVLPSHFHFSAPVPL